ncbi:hypothetical protein X975_15314, partial [Stegodyphus mimosarum]
MFCMCSVSAIPMVNFLFILAVSSDSLTDENVHLLPSFKSHGIGGIV